MTDISRHENMEYDVGRDVYICKKRKKLTAAGTKTRKNVSGYKSTATVYRCDGCQGYPYKEKCIKDNCRTPMEERSKVLYVSKIREEKRMLSCCHFDYGCYIFSLSNSLEK